VKKLLSGLLLFVSVGYVFAKSPVRYVSDSRYSLLMDQAILEHGSPNLMAYKLPDHLWTIGFVNGQLLYLYPWGGPLLSLPIVAALGAGGIKVAPDGIYSVRQEVKMQFYVTTFLCAAIVWLFFDLCAATLSIGWSVAIALAAAFGTQIWSSASRSLWPQTWYLLLASLAVWLLMKPRLRPALLSTTLAWACFARPQGFAVALMVGFYLFLECGVRKFLVYAVVGGAWTAIFAALMLHYFGRILPPVYPARLDFPHEFAFRLAGILLSPSRGLLVFVPIVLLPLYLTLRYWQHLPRRRLAALAIAAITSHLVMTACWPNWWGGGSYGPRLLMDPLPWFVVLAALGFGAFLDDRKPAFRERTALISIGALLLIVSVAMNAVGAVSVSATTWNEKNSIDLNPRRAWDWKYPQFLAWMRPR
jgi:hypothetical protein